MALWTVQLLGDARLIAADGTPIAVPASVFALIGYLSTRRSGLAPRRLVAAQLWPDQDDDHARHALATCLWRLKSVTASEAVLIEVHGDTLKLADDIAIDMLQFEGHIRAARANAAAQIDDLTQATELYGGMLLEGHDADWILLERERLTCLYIDALVDLAVEHAAHGQWSCAAEIARRATSAEPLREDAHRLIMEANLRLGNRALALRQYRTCCDILARELDVEPMPETRLLAERLREPRVSNHPLSGNAQLHSAISESRATMVAALKAFDRAIALI